MAETKKTTSTAKKTTSTAAKKPAATKVAAPKTEAPKVEEKKVEAPKAETKPAKVEKKETKKAEPKPVVTEARATANDVRVTPRKARLVLDLIRGKAVNEALGILANTPKAAAPIVAKVIKGAASNAINNFGMNEDKLYVAICYANEGIRMKRFLPRAKGSASGLVKRSAKITVVVKER